MPMMGMVVSGVVVMRHLKSHKFSFAYNSFVFIATTPRRCQAIADQFDEALIQGQIPIEQGKRTGNSRPRPEI
jgi:hypothetical protein